MHEFVTQLADSFGRALGPVLISLLTLMAKMAWDAWKLRRRHKPIAEQGQFDRQIQDRLTECRVRIKAQRVYLCKFFNGHFYDDDSPIQKYSRTHESVVEGTANQAMLYEQILVSLVPEEMRLVSEDGPSFSEVGKLHDGKFRRMVEAANIKAVARCAVRRGKEIIAFVGADFTDSGEAPANITELVTLAGTLEQLLSRQ